MEKVMNELKNIFSMDLRGIAMARFLLVACLIYDILDRSRFIYAHYTDEGVLPRAAIIEHDSLDWVFSLHMLSGEFYYQVILFTINFVVAFLLLTGYRTKLMLILAWVFLHSVHARNSLITTGGDMVLRLMLFWIIFLPIGAKWSADRWLDKNKGAAAPTSLLIANPATLAYIIQILSIYFFAAFLKTGNTWADGSAVYYSLMLDHYVQPFGKFLVQYPSITGLLTHFTMILEQWGFVLFFIPFKWQWFRLVGVVSFIALHLGFIFTLHLGLFPFICIAAWIPLLPPMVWDFLGSVNFIRKPLLAFKTKVIALLTWLKERDFIYERPILTYDYGKTGMAIAGVLTVFVVYWNMVKIKAVDPMPSAMSKVVRYARINQKWSMFAPNPSKSDGWYVMPADFSDGSKLDLRTGLPVTFDKPEMISCTFPNHRWRKYFNNFHRKSKSKYRRYYGSYLTRVWKQKLKGTDVRLETFVVHYMLEKTRPDFEETAPKKLTLWKHWTDKKYKKRFYPDEEKGEKSDSKKKIDKEDDDGKARKSKNEPVTIGKGEKYIPSDDSKKQKTDSTDDVENEQEQSDSTDNIMGGEPEKKADEDIKKSEEENFDGE